jgi:hypothetical protein
VPASSFTGGGRLERNRAIRYSVGMKFLVIVLFSGMALGQQAASAAAPQLPIKLGEWKMIAMVHASDGDKARSFFNCNTTSDLAHLVPQPSHLPDNVSCSEDSQQLTGNGVTVSLTCKTPDSVVKTTYDLTRNSDTLVTGTMKMSAEVGGQHQESTTNIAYQWQQAECVNHDAPKAEAKPAPSLETPGSK